jgi:2-amino-4-hydroxy-6-hydroxymethyldihydropteridine diphosphokinase
MSPSSSNASPEGHDAVRAVISLGSNVGEREKYVLSAASSIATSKGIQSARLSSLYETLPVGENYSSPFINSVMIVETVMSPRSLVELGSKLEIEAGRVRGAGKNDRTLDIDLILHGSSTIDEPDLIVPHPRFMDRLFVLVPLAELEPDFPLPGGLTASEAVEIAYVPGEVIRVSSRSRIRRKSL